MINKYNYKRVAFADALKDEVAAKWNLERWSFDDDALKETRPQGFAYTRRQLLQIHGREKRMLNPHYWIERAKIDIERLLAAGERVVITDARFPEEITIDIAKEISIKIRIERPAYHALQQEDKHESETALDGYPFDVIICNKEKESSDMLIQFEEWIKTLNHV